MLINQAQGNANHVVCESLRSCRVSFEVKEVAGALCILNQTELQTAAVEMAMLSFCLCC